MSTNIHNEKWRFFNIGGTIRYPFDIHQIKIGTKTDAIYTLGSTVIEGHSMTILYYGKSIVFNVNPSTERFAVDDESSLVYFTNADEPPLFSVYQFDFKTMAISMAKRDDSGIGGPSGKLFVIGQNQVVVSGKSSPGNNLI